MRRDAWARAVLALAMTLGPGIAACQLVSGIADLDIVDDAGDAAASDATADSTQQNDGQIDSTTEAAPDATAEAEAEASSDSSPDSEETSDGMADAGDGSDATLDASDASDGRDAADGSSGSDASDAGDAKDAAVEAGCQFGWQCPAGYCAAGQCTEPPSCQGLAQTCGPAQDQDCCQSLVIPTGDGGVSYQRSFDPPINTDAGAPATLAGYFALDRFEVTVERFEKFIAGYDGSPPATGSGAYPPVANTGWNPSWTLPATQTALTSAVTACSPSFAPPSGVAAMNPHAPMNCVDWYLAFAFCAWDGSRLPTEAEWNFAAAGGTAQREYPWSMGPPQIDSTYAWYDCLGPGNTQEPDGSAGPCPNTGPMTYSVGSESPKGDGLWSHSDLAGSVSEPTLDFFGAYPIPCTNCVNTTSTNGNRVYRGGSFMDVPSVLDTGARQSIAPGTPASTLGIRCAR